MYAKNKNGDYMTYHSDIADELILNKKHYKKEEKQLKDVKMTTINILKDQNKFNKEKGKYISIDFNNMYDDTIKDEISSLLIEALKTLYKIKSNDKVLIIGLGNQKIISDSLGPNVADKILVTNHLFSLFPEDIEESLKRVCVFTPKVMGQTGLESADLVDSVAKLFKPNIIIVIDALASSSIKRINKVIQLSDTGIAPGSGVGNYRKQINEKTLKVKVIAIGVATVVKAYQLINELNIKVPEDELYEMILTPKEIDEDINMLSSIIATSINKYIHANYKKL